MSLEVAVINGSECYCVASFTDLNGNPYTPSSLSYQIDDLTNGVVVLPSTVVPTPATTVSIPITASQNVMNALSEGVEERQVTLKIGIPGGTSRNDCITYRLVRKTGTP